MSLASAAVAPTVLRLPTVRPLAGTVLSASNGLPVAGLTVRATLFSSSTESRAPLVTLGDAGTDSIGRFVIADESSDVRQLVTLLDTQAELPLTLGVFDAAGTRVPHTELGATSPRSIRRLMLVELPRTGLRSEHWQLLGTRVKAAGIQQLHEVVRRLVLVPRAQSLVPEWNELIRHAVIDALATAFLDPKGILSRFASPPVWYELRQPGGLEAYVALHKDVLGTSPSAEALYAMSGKVEVFDSVAQVDWVFDVEELEAGNPAAAVSKFESAYEVDVATPKPVVNGSDPQLASYRNYLRAIFTGEPGSANYETWREQLDTRFHQNFETTSAFNQPANKIINGILDAILKAPGSQSGFGIAPGSIEPQGQRTPAEYRDYLISLTQLSRMELALRYRLDLELPDTVTSNRIQQNIFTLQRFYADGFQSAEDPAQIIPGTLLGKPPFFLQYEEWQQLTSAFHAENYLRIRDTVDSGFNSDEKKYFEDHDHPSEDGFIRWFYFYIRMEDKLASGHEKLAQHQYKEAVEKYNEALQFAHKGVFTGVSKDANAVKGELSPSMNLSAQSVYNKIAPLLNALKSTPVESLDDLEGPHYSWNLTNFMAQYKIFWMRGPSSNYWEFRAEAEEDYPQHLFSLVHALLYVIPICLADAFMASGDYETAEYYYGLTTGLPVARADLRAGAGYPIFDSYGIWAATDIHGGGSAQFPIGRLPYSVDVSNGVAEKALTYEIPNFAESTASDASRSLAALIVPKKTHALERRFFRLRHGNALLEWADALYRAGDSASVARARELYKAVMFLHKVPPPISPLWDNMRGVSHTVHKQNPATTSQLSRAKVALFQIDHSLNYFGTTSAHVPSLRYRPLKDAADTLAAGAKAAESDFLLAVSKIEEMLREHITIANLLKKARLQATIADEQKGIAEFGVMLAQRQIDAIEAQIKAKQDEIAEHDGLGEQFIDFVTGFKEAVEGIPDWATDGLNKDSVKAGVGIGTIAAEGGTFGGGGWLGLGAGASAAGAYGVFVYAGVTSMVNMGDAMNLRASDLQTLRDDALPLAEAQKAAKEREVTIATLQRQIAEADAQLAHDLLHFQVVRTLSIEFWSNIASVLKRLLRRYLELGARYAWLAERALAYEQDRELGIVRFDYFPAKLFGVTGGDLLRLDLAELEAARLSGTRQAVPLKHTYSLAFDFPLAFAALKITGKCTFRTVEKGLRDAYPGAYGFRIRSLSLAIQTVNPTGALRGLLSNGGVSVISRKDGSTHSSARFMEAFPLSEFRSDAPGVYALSQETLGNFEGSGIESFWTLEFPIVANPWGLTSLADIQLTFELNASYSADLHHKLTPRPTSVRRFVFASMRAQASDAMDTLRGSAESVTLDFDFRKLPFSKREGNRRIVNLVLAAVSPGELEFTATLASAQVTALVNFEKGVSISNAPPFHNGQQDAPLNAFQNAPLDETFHLSIDKPSNAGVDFGGTKDFLIGVDYTADLV